MEWILAITAIIGAALQLYESGANVAQGIVSGEMQGKYAKLINKVNQLMKDNDQWATKLTNAYNHKNGKQMQSLLLASPAGAAFYHLKDEIEKGQNEYTEQLKQVSAFNSEANKAMTEGQAYLNKAASNMYTSGEVGRKLDDLQRKVDEASSTAKQAMEGGLKQNV